MPIARYTSRLITQPLNDGECCETVPYSGSVSVARSRIFNAASRISMGVTTEWDPTTRKVRGYAKVI